MPRVNFEALPDAARLWVFSAATPVMGAAAQSLLERVDRELDGWRAHGVPLVCARDWRDDRFLAIGVNEAATDASGCSIDAMFSALRAHEGVIGTTLVGNGAVYWRDASGTVQSVTRPVFRAIAADGAVSSDTPVFDTAITTASAWRTAFEKPARDSWHARLLPPAR